MSETNTRIEGRSWRATRRAALRSGGRPTRHNDSAGQGAPAGPLDAARDLLRDAKDKLPPFDLPDPFNSLAVPLRESLPADVREALKAPLRQAMAERDASLVPPHAVGRVAASETSGRVGCIADSAPTPALRADPPPQAGEGEEKNAAAIEQSPPVVRPYITAAESAHWGYVDPSRPVERIIEETWPDERLPRRPQLQQRAWRSAAEAEENAPTDAHGWRIIR